MSRAGFVVTLMALLPLAAVPTFSQEAFEYYSKNCIYVELGGTGILYSIDYEHRFTEHFSGRIGFSTWSLPTFAVIVNGSFDMTSFPVLLNYLAGGNGHYLELGMGPVFYVSSFTGQLVFFGNEVSGQSTGVLGAATVGYRYQPRKGLLFRIGVTPLTSFRKTLFWGGISLGVVF